MKKAIISGFDRLVLPIIVCVLAGIMAGCSRGFPVPDFLLQGTVTDSRSGTPIMHLQVVNFRPHPLGNDTTYTDSNGKFRFEYETETWEKADFSYEIKIEDIDGLANKGEFAEQTLSGTLDELRPATEDRDGRYEKTLEVEMQAASQSGQ